MGKSILILEERANEIQKYVAILVEKYAGDLTEEQCVMVEESLANLYMALDPKVVTNLEAYIPE